MRVVAVPVRVLVEVVVVLRGGLAAVSYMAGCVPVLSWVVVGRGVEARLSVWKKAGGNLS